MRAAAVPRVDPASDPAPGPLRRAQPGVLVRSQLEEGTLRPGEGVLWLGLQQARPGGLLPLPGIRTGLRNEYGDTDNKWQHRY